MFNFKKRMSKFSLRLEMNEAIVILKVILWKNKGKILVILFLHQEDQESKKFSRDLQKHIEFAFAVWKMGMEKDALNQQHSNSYAKE